MTTLTTDAQTQVWGPITMTGGRVIIELNDGGPPLELANPTFGLYEDADLKLDAMRSDVARGEESLKTISDPVGLADQRAALKKASNQAVAEWWRMLAAGCGNRELPEDPRTWPCQLIVGQQACAEVLLYWTQNPLARGRLERMIAAQQALPRVG